MATSQQPGYPAAEDEPEIEEVGFWSDPASEKEAAAQEFDEESLAAADEPQPEESVDEEPWEMPSNKGEVTRWS